MQLFQQRYHGFIIDNKLSFDQHICAIHKPSQQRLRAHKHNSAHPVVLFFLLLYQQKQNDQDYTYCLPSHLPLFPQSHDRAITVLALMIANDRNPPISPHFTLLPPGRKYMTYKWRSEEVLSLSSTEQTACVQTHLCVSPQDDKDYVCLDLSIYFQLQVRECNSVLWEVVDNIQLTLKQVLRLYSASNLRLHSQVKEITVTNCVVVVLC